MEKFISVFQIITAVFIFLFAVGTTIRCIVNGSDIFYIIMFSLMALVGRSMLRYTIAEYKELKHGNNK